MHHRVFSDCCHSDFWAPIADVSRGTLSQLSSTGAHGHVLQVVDPAEETFPYSGRVEFIEPEGGESITAGRAEAWKADTKSLVANHRAGARDRQARLELCPSTVPTGRQRNFCLRCTRA